MKKEIFKETKSDEFRKSADIDSGNYRVFLSSLDLDRTLRIYKSLFQLSVKAVDAATGGKSTEFSSFTDKMRPLMSYIADNNLKLSSFFDECDSTTSELISKDPNIKETVRALLKNLKTIQSVRETMGAVPFNSAFLASEELTNAFIDFKLDLAWDFEHDAIIILNLADIRLIHFLVRRGQKRFILAGGTVELESCRDLIGLGCIFFRQEDYKSLMEQGGVPAFPGRPMHRFAIFDLGQEAIPEKEIAKIVVGVHNARNDQWGKFNTINRADATRVLNNLKNMAFYDQTSIFHNKFKDRAAVIVCPGPSLSKNIDLLKRIKGQIVIICVLHALKDLQKRGINPDIVVHVDPADLKSLKTKKGQNEISFWDQWIVDNDFSRVGCFVVSNYSKPEIFDIPEANVTWMSSGLPLGELLPIEVFDYERVGGSVAHASLDLAIELGCYSIVLLGQDLAFSKGGEQYSSHADLNLSEEDKLQERLKVYGNDVEVKGWHGGKVISNNTFVSFAKAFEFHARQLDNEEIKLYNCTEGGIFLEGYEHCKFIDFIETELKNRHHELVSERLNKLMSKFEIKSKRLDKTRKFIVRSNILASEIGEIIGTLIPLAKKSKYDDADLQKFDKLQNKMLKKMSKNKFYSLGLQRDIHILQAGLRADPSVEGQLGFHLDFLQVAQHLNNRFIQQFTDQLNQIKTI